MTIYEKLSEIQQKIKVPKTRKNEFGNFNFRNAEDIMRAFKKFEIEHRVVLILSDAVVSIGNSNYVESTATLYDLDSTENVSAKASAKEPPQTKAKMDESQTSGSTSSYARKYALNGLLLLDDCVDLDSNQFIDSGETATEAQVNTIQKIAKDHNVNLEALYKKHKVKEVPTAAQAGLILGIFKKKFGDE